MSLVPDTSLISAFSVPGTHDSTAISSTSTVGCQMMDITTQLNSGIRFINMWCGLVKNVLFMFHNFYPINPPDFLPFASVVSSIETWLGSYSSEAVIVQIRQDNYPIASTISFATAVSNLISKSASFWIIGDTIPTLQTVRGKIQLVRRYPVNNAAGEASIGIDLIPRDPAENKIGVKKKRMTKTSAAKKRDWPVAARSIGLLFSRHGQAT